MNHDKNYAFSSAVISFELGIRDFMVLEDYAVSHRDGFVPSLVLDIIQQWVWSVSGSPAEPTSAEVTE